MQKLQFQYAERNVIIISTSGYTPAQDYLEIAVRTFPMLYDKDYELNEEIEVDNIKPLVLP